MAVSFPPQLLFLDEDPLLSPPVLLWKGASLNLSLCTVCVHHRGMYVLYVAALQEQEKKCRWDEETVRETVHWSLFQEV